MMAKLPDYRVRRSARTKSLHLKITRDGGLWVVVPSGFDERKIPAILERKKSWIAAALKRTNEAKRFLEQKTPAHLPETLMLTALGESWTLTFRRDENRHGLRLEAGDGRLVISGAVLERERVLEKLKDWLRRRVREGLFPLAENIAVKQGWKMEGLLVKNQRTRWASCSARGNLSLNTKLLFLSPELVRYVIVHELCRTVHKNHSREFWRLVQAHEPGYRRLDMRLRDAWKRVPQWLL